MEGGAHTAGALLPRCPGAVQTDHGLLSAQEVPCSMTRQPEMAAQLVPAQARQGAACAGSTCAGHSNCRPSARAGLTSLDRRAALSGSRVHTRRVWGRLHSVDSDASPDSLDSHSRHRCPPFDPTPGRLRELTMRLQQSPSQRISAQ